MKALPLVAEAFSRWIDSVAGTVLALHNRLAPPHIVVLVEDEPGDFVIQADRQITDEHSAIERIKIADGKVIGALPASVAEKLSGSRIELVLRSDRFLFRPLELPGRAAEFLDGIIRSQIDRLTPWTAAEAAFGWSKPLESEADRFITTIAAIALEKVAPYLRAISAMGVQSTALFTLMAKVGSEPSRIKVLEGSAGGAVDIGRIRHALKAILIAAGVGTVATISASVIVGASFDSQQEEIARQIASARVATSTSGDVAVGSIAAAHRTLEQLKHDVPSGVLVLESLSQILPDNTYVTELRIEDSKLRMTGVTKNAPSLIGLLEQSGRFTRATFFAPTTQSPSDPSEHFHIEADIQPLVPRS